MPEMPPVEAGGYLIGYLWEIGPTMGGGMGASPITHEEILAWAVLLGVPLQPWEARLLRRLSLAFVTELHRAEKIDATAPWAPEAFDAERRSAAARSMRESMRAMATG